MASLSAILQLVDLATGESSYGSYANWGEVADFNFSALEDAVGEVTSKTLSSSDVTLTADEERSLLIKLSGTLSANVAVRTNDRKGFWFVTNDTTGDFTVTFKTTSGTGIVVPQGGRAILVSDGTNVLRMMNVGSGGSASRPVYASKSGAYTALQSDDGAMHEYSATATVSFKPAALLGAGWTYVVRANGGIVTLDPNASELVNGAATLAIADGTSAIIICTGTAFRVIVVGTGTGNGDVTLTGTQTLTNKTLTSPIISGTVTGSFTIDHNSGDTPALTVITGLIPNMESLTGAQQGLQINNNNNASASAVMAFHRQGAHALYFGLDIDNKMKIGGWSLGANAYPMVVLGSSTYNVGNLTIDGNITATGNITASSDISLKEDIRTFSTALETVQRLRGVRFRRKETGKEGVGFIAQEVEGVLPELVHENGDGIKSVAYGNFVAVLVEAVKELSERVGALEGQA